MELLGFLDASGAQSVEANPAGERTFDSAVCRPEEQLPNAKKDVCSSGLPRWKRGMDIGCIVALAPLWMPLMILIALWIRFASPGPVFYRQERIGFRGRRFMMLKFRSMKVNADTEYHERHFDRLVDADAPMIKLDSAGDSRLIAGGWILRATGLDELPQFFNVLRSEMSLVGPRPCTPRELNKYQQWQQERFDATPGLTGYWQVNGKNNTTFSKMIELDIFYARNKSFCLDLAIMLRTFPALVAQVLGS
jgi:lipopolysaccharide/colanic/teichoic acid biosynthesis glycosyltransferase